MKRAILASLIIFVFTFAFGQALMAAGYGPDTYSGKATTFTSMTTNDLTSMEKAAQKLVGQSKDELIKQMGKPAAISKDKKNDQIYSYEIRLASDGPGKPHWLQEDFIVNASGTVVRASTSTL